MSDIIILNLFKGKEGVREFTPYKQKKCLSISIAQQYVLDKGIEYYTIKLNGSIIERKGYCEKDEPEDIIIIVGELVIDYLQSKLGFSFKTWFELKKGSGEIAIYFNDRIEAISAFKLLSNNSEFEILETIKESLCLSFRTLTPNFNQVKQWNPETTKKLPAINKDTLSCWQKERALTSFTWEMILAAMN